MTYEEELRAKLDAVRPLSPSATDRPVDTMTREQKILNELDGEFAFARYDLDESDILRTLKILDILRRYGDVFRRDGALRLFYTLARVEVILPKNLHAFSRLTAENFKGIIREFAQHKLLLQNENGELELTLDGKSLAARMGLDIYM